ncbi:LysE family translocator [Vibrio hippocampi]|uniref:Threonine efflux protein n=1 Tax=Vibrio hippocampi TaxID=654686 RepID=A0ABN8DC81_9VIBR|nr:LysE family translocator [Vibrio hippocampi]CAH0524223.1 Threonine efflux protein [Vibrio hippocampi]
MTLDDFSPLITLMLVHIIGLMSPGPDFALVVQNTAKYGRVTGVYIALGLSIGILIHSTLSLTGISFVIQQSPNLYLLLQIAGGSYLTYLGIGALRSVLVKPTGGERSDSNNAQVLITNQSQALFRGLTTNLLNPKALVFFVSLMSSLIPTTMPVLGKGLAIGLLWVLSFFWFAFLAWALSTQRVQRKLAHLTGYIDAICGVMFCALGLIILVKTLMPEITG